MTHEDIFRMANNWNVTSMLSINGKTSNFILVTNEDISIQISFLKLASIGAHKLILLISISVVFLQT